MSASTFALEPIAGLAETEPRLSARISDAAGAHPLLWFLVAAFALWNNAVSGEYVSPMFTGTDSTRQSWLLVLVWGVAALLVCVRAKSFTQSTRHPNKKGDTP